METMAWVVITLLLITICVLLAVVFENVLEIKGHVTSVQNQTDHVVGKETELVHKVNTIESDIADIKEYQKVKKEME